MRTRARARWSLAAVLLLAASAGAAPPAAEFETRAAQALLRDAADLRRVARWGDEHDLLATTEGDWLLVLAWDPKDDAARKRLGYQRQDGAWTRDDAAWARRARPSDVRADRRPEYALRRAKGFERPAADRWRDLATWARRAGLEEAADRALRTAVSRDPDDPWSRLALGEVEDPAAGWVPFDVRARRIAQARAAAEVRRLRAQRAEPVERGEVSARSAAVGAPLATWTLHEWRLETDLGPEAAVRALEAADLAARWFRGLVGLEAGSPILPAGATFVVLSTVERYVKAVEAEPGLSAAERAFGRDLSAMPVQPERGGRFVVLVLRPDATTAADACLHYAAHFLGQAWARIESSEAWLYEGLAAYAGIRLVGTQGSWCVRLESTSAAKVEPARPDPVEWGFAALRQAHARADVPCAALFGATLNGMDGEMLIKSWSLLRWMFEDRLEEGRVFLAARRGGLTTPEALRAATGLTPDALDEAWRRHVLATEGE